MITDIKINHLRNLEFEKYIKINPLTVLLGKNSSGKSTFLRTFPLFKQSIETKRSTPLLWYGRLVDFGSFEESKNKYPTAEDINFGFNIKINKIKTNIEMTLVKEKEIKYLKEIEYLKEIRIVYKNNNIYLNINKHQELETIIINDENKSIDGLYFSDLKQALPSHILRKKKQTVKKNYFNYFWNNIGNYELAIKKIIKIFRIEINNEKEIEQYFYNLFWFFKHYSLYDEKELFNIILKFLGKDVKEQLPEEARIDYRFLFEKNEPLKFKCELNLNFNDIEKELTDLKNLLILENLNDIIDLLNENFKNIFNNVFYIAPIRATAERYYRIQGLDTDDINPDGNNLPMYLKNLKTPELDAFSTWTKNNFKFEPTISNGSGGHISLQIKQGESEINLADTGFGFSQILPIILQIWRKIHRTFSRDEGTQMFIIEQPELHLHPAMQAMLVDIIIKSIKMAKEKKIEIQFIIETHSETIINRIGKHVMQELIDENDISLLIFNKISQKNLEIKETKYDCDGSIEEWPFGFFEPEVIIK